MANKRITQLNEYVGAPSNSDVFVFVQNSSLSTYKITYASLLSGQSVISNVNQNSAYWTEAYTNLVGNSANWNSTYSTVQSLSDSWEESAVIAPLQSASANWNSVYSTTNTNSSYWSEAYTNLVSNSANWTNVNVISTDATFLSISADNFDIYLGKILNVRSGSDLRINFESSLPAGFNLSVLNETTFNVTLTSSVDGVFKAFGTVLSGSNGIKNLYSSATVYKYGTNLFAIGSLV